MDPSAFSHPCIHEGWFKESSDESFPGQAFCLRVKKILHHEKSQFQDILVFESTNFGNVLVLDGIIQVTERDEFAYQEMIAHLPLMSHPNPKRILVIGGGDGGVLREIVKHDNIAEATLVEIDETVIELSKKYLPEMSKSFNNEKVNVVLQDGFNFLKSTANSDEKYDIIITDSSDPEGPAVAFFQKEYFQLLYDALNPDGIVISQASENVWLNLAQLKSLITNVKEIYPVVKYSQCYMPSYTSGQLGLIICSKDIKNDVSKPTRVLTSAQEKLMFKYYSHKIHEASFVIPLWAENLLDE